MNMIQLFSQLHTLFECFKLEKGKEHVYGGSTNKCLFCVSFLYNDKTYYLIKNGLNNNSFYVNGKVFNNYVIIDEKPYEFGYIQFNCNMSNVDMPENINDLRSNIIISKNEVKPNIRVQSSEIMETINLYMKSNPSDKDEYAFKFKVPSLIKDTCKFSNCSTNNKLLITDNTQNQGNNGTPINNTIFNSIYEDGHIYTNSFPKRIESLLDIINKDKIERIKLRNNELMQNTLLEFKDKVSMALCSKNTSPECASEVNKLIESINNSLKATK